MTPEDASSPETTTAPDPVPGPPLSNTQKAILEALVNAASTIHAGGPITALAEKLYGKEHVTKAQNDRREDEKMQGENGWHGETPGYQALARAYTMLLEDGEDNAADELDAIALSHLVKADWENHVQAIRRGF